MRTTRRPPTGFKMFHPCCAVRRILAALPTPPEHGSALTDFERAGGPVRDAFMHGWGSSSSEGTDAAAAHRETLDALSAASDAVRAWTTVKSTARNGKPVVPDAGGSEFIRDHRPVGNTHTSRDSAAIAMNVSKPCPNASSPPPAVQLGQVRPRVRAEVKGARRAHQGEEHEYRRATHRSSHLASARSEARLEMRTTRTTAWRSGGAPRRFG